MNITMSLSLFFTITGVLLVLALVGWARVFYLKGKLKATDNDGWIDEAEWWRSIHTQLLGGELSLDKLGQQVLKHKQRAEED